MPATIEQGTTAAEKIYQRLINQGRSHSESARDACRWVLETMGLTVTLNVSQPQDGGLVYCSKCRTSRTAGTECWTCWNRKQQTQDSYQRQTRTNSRRSSGAGAEKRSRAARKAHATRVYNKAKEAYGEDRITWEELKRARQVWNNTVEDINTGR